MIRLRKHPKPIMIRVALTPAQWHEVAQRSASDYHDWMDACENARFIDDSRRALFVDEVNARWIVSLFGQGALA